MTKNDFMVEEEIHSFLYEIRRILLMLLAGDLLRYKKPEEANCSKASSRIRAVFQSLIRKINMANENSYSLRLISESAPPIVNAISDLDDEAVIKDAVTAFLAPIKKGALN